MTLEQLRAQREALQFARFHGVRTVKAGHDTYWDHQVRVMGWPADMTGRGFAGSRMRGARR